MKETKERGRSWRGQWVSSRRFYTADFHLLTSFYMLYIGVDTVGDVGRIKQRTRFSASRCVLMSEEPANGLPANRHGWERRRSLTGSLAVRSSHMRRVMIQSTEAGTEK